MSESRREDVGFEEKHEVCDCNYGGFGAMNRLMGVDKNKATKSGIRVRMLIQDKV